MSQLEVDKIIPQSGTTLTIGDSGDTVNFADGTNLSIDTNTLYIDSTNNRVGIANSSPSVALDVTGAAKVSGDLTVDTNTLYVDSTNNRVGIGTTSPQKTFVVSNSGAEGYEISPTDVSAVIREIAYNRNTSTFNTLRTQASQHHFYIGDVEKARLDASGNLGIGTSSPSTKLHIDEGGEPPAEGMLILQANSTQRQLRIQPPTDADNGFIDFKGGNLTFLDDGTEVARFQSTTAFLVGKTSTNYQTVGHELLATGRAFHTADGGKTLSLNRLTSDGAIVDFYKDGTEVGSIGAKDGDLIIGTGDVGLRFEDAGDNIFPINVSTGAGEDNHTDLGTSSARFKNLYLSGGLYVGGTGTSNKLDDYEEGTFTPTLTQGTPTTQYGYYTKIGEVVNFTIVLGGNMNTSSTSDVRITLPFTSTSTIEKQTHITIMSMYVNISNKSVTGYIGTAKNYMQIYVNGNSSNVWETLKYNQFSSSSAYLRCTGFMYV